MMIDNGYENSMVLPDYSDSYACDNASEISWDARDECGYEERICDDCGRPCGETCEELGPLTKEDSDAA